MTEEKFGGQHFQRALVMLKAVSILALDGLRRLPESESCDELAKMVDAFYLNITNLERTHQLKREKWLAHQEKEAAKAARKKQRESNAQ